MNLADDYYFYRARYYEPGVGRFTQVDPLLRDADFRNSLQSLSAYAYVNNIPTMLVDPTGEKSCPQDRLIKEYQDILSAYGRLVNQNLGQGHSCVWWATKVWQAVKNVDRCCFCVGRLIRELNIGLGKDRPVPHHTAIVWPGTTLYSNGTVLDPWPLGLPFTFDYYTWNVLYFYLPVERLTDTDCGKQQ